MSCYNEERGLWMLPMAAYGEVKTKVLEVAAGDCDAYAEAKGSSKVIVTVADGEAYIAFEDSTFSVAWRVEENNRAVERAHENHTAIALFNALAAVKWTEGTGGGAKYADEYQRDAMQGPSECYVYGPKCEAWEGRSGR